MPMVVDRHTPSASLGDVAGETAGGAYAHSTGPTDRPVWPALLDGARGKCPKCHKGHMFRAYLKVADSCEACGQELHHHRADDAPPYFTIFISGHVIIPLMIVMEKFWAPALWLHMAIWIPLTIAVCMALLPPVKGALVALQWALRMHGFAAEHEAPDSGLPWPEDVRQHLDSAD